MRTIAYVCGFAFGKCMKIYLFSMLPAVWFWFPVLCAAKYLDKKKGE